MESTKPMSKPNKDKIAPSTIFAWSSLNLGSWFLKKNFPEYAALVHFPDNCAYNLEGKYATLQDEKFIWALERFLYLSKVDTKTTDDGFRNFGCSQFPVYSLWLIRQMMIWRWWIKTLIYPCQLLPKRAITQYDAPNIFY